MATDQTPETTKPVNPFALEHVARATDSLRDAAKRRTLFATVVHADQNGGRDHHAADVLLQRAALAYAAAKLAETGEHGTMDALVLLRQIAEGLE